MLQLTIHQQLMAEACGIPCMSNLLFLTLNGVITNTIQTSKCNLQAITITLQTNKPQWPSQKHWVENLPERIVVFSYNWVFSETWKFDEGGQKSRLIHRNKNGPSKSISPNCTFFSKEAPCNSSPLSSASIAQLLRKVGC